MAETQYDVIVIGGGPGGYVAAIRAAQLGMKTAIVERDALGGVCLNWGCIPTKSLLKNAEVVRTVQDGKTWGIQIDGAVTLNYGKAHERSRQVSQRLVKGVGFLMKKNKIDVYQDTAVLNANKQVELKGGGKNWRASISSLPPAHARVRFPDSNSTASMSLPRAKHWI